MNEAMQRILNSAAALNESVKKAPGRDQSFGDEIVKAVKAKLAFRSHSPVVIAENAAKDDSFAERLKKAVEERSPAKRHKERAERERQRYEEPAERGLQSPHP
jgi:hypothetical protein